MKARAERAEPVFHKPFQLTVQMIPFEQEKPDAAEFVLVLREGRNPVFTHGDMVEYGDYWGRIELENK